MGPRSLDLAPRHSKHGILDAMQACLDPVETPIFGRWVIPLMQVGLEELSKGFSHTEDMVVSIFIPYCETGFEWEVVIDGEAPDRCPDLIPLPSTEAEVSKVSSKCGE